MARLKLFSHIDEMLTLSPAAKKQARSIIESDLGIVKKAALLELGGKIIWRGKMSQVGPSLFRKLGVSAPEFEKNLKGHQVIPAFTECHTHTIFAGDRKNEFELRNQGQTYAQIAQAGGGIASTVKQTRKATTSELLTLAQKRVDGFVEQGVSCLEVKSGYGLEDKTEFKMLKVARLLKGPKIVKTYLGLHGIPKEKNANDYLQHVLQVSLPQLKKFGLVDRVDMFVERDYFAVEQARQLIQAAHAMNLPVGLHTDQLSRSGGLKEYLLQGGVQSLDHLVQISSSDVSFLAKQDVTCVLLPSADFYLKMNYPPARSLLDQGARVAIATDFNPGSSPSQDLSLVGVLSRLEMKMSLSEVICAYTLGASYALGLQNERGSLDVGKQCDFAVIKGSWQDLFYQIGHHPVVQTWKNGRRITIQVKKS